MNKKRWRRIVGGTVAIIVAIAIGGWFAFNMLMDKAIDMVFGGTATQLEQQIDEQLNQQFTEEQLKNTAGQPQEKSEKGNDAVQTHVAAVQTEEKTETAAPATSSDATKAKKYVHQENISIERASDVKSNISATDKIAVATVLLKKLSANELDLFAKMASGGITREEKKEAKKVFLQKLTEEEYNDLIAIAAKYGLSKGRNYQETQEDYR